MTVQLFCGYDEREAVGFHVFVSSVLSRASVSVAIRPLGARGMPTGSNAFTVSRFLVPWLMGFKGSAIFVDGSDMLCCADVAELAGLADLRYAVQVVKHPDYESRHSRKYVGTEMECEQSNYSRKNWASCAIFNCDHSAWSGLTPEALRSKTPLELLQLRLLADHEIGDLPGEWNTLVDEGHETSDAKILHWSSGIPFFAHYRNAPRADDWFKELEIVMGAWSK
jgi:hypothetical protein